MHFVMLLVGGFPVGHAERPLVRERKHALEPLDFHDDLV